MKAAIARRPSRGPMEFLAGTFLVVMCATLAVVCLTFRSGVAD